jgi:hypothetical protein
VKWCPLRAVSPEHDSLDCAHWTDKQQVTDKQEKKTPHELEIEIDADGRVVLTDLPQDLVDLVLALDPDARIGCDLPANPAPKPRAGESTGKKSGRGQRKGGPKTSGD